MAQPALTRGPVAPPVPCRRAIWPIRRARVFARSISRFSQIVRVYNKTKSKCLPSRTVCPLGTKISYHVLNPLSPFRTLSAPGRHGGGGPGGVGAPPPWRWCGGIPPPACSSASTPCWCVRCPQFLVFLKIWSQMPILRLGRKCKCKFRYKCRVLWPQIQLPQRLLLVCSTSMKCGIFCFSNFCRSPARC